tara:strand:- start:561 stop:857 length:297 start_codon:yes stop_codon:yes gene_type:complete
MSTFNYNSGSFSGSLSDSDLKLWFGEFEGHEQIGSWISNFISHKTEKMYKRLQIEWTPKLINDSTVLAISASREEFINQVVTNSNYKTAYEIQVSGSL